MSRQWFATLGCVVLVGAMLTSVADAHIGVSHSPFTTDGPDLASVTLDSNVVDFCFDEDVIGPLNAGDFSLLGHDSGTISQGDNVGLDAQKAECVEVGFNGGREETEFTIGTVAADAVENRAGAGNVEASAGLTGSAAPGGAGRTAAPNLLDYDVDDAADEITYSFDQDIDCPGAPPPAFYGAFGFYKQAGEGGVGGRENGDAVSDCDDNEVTIFFNPPGVDNVERVLVDGGGSEPCALASDSGPGQCTGYEGQGSGETDSPDLVNAERTSEDEITFTFDQDATVNSDDEFHVFSEDGTDFFGSVGGCQEDDEEIECEFAGIEDSADSELVLAGVNDGAVDDVADPTLSNTVASAPLGDGSVAAGFSDGPDLETCSIDAGNGLGSFVFDEPVDENSAAQQDFAIFDGEGNLTDGTDIDSASGNSISVEFDDDAFEAPVGCHVDLGAVDDFMANGSPPAAVGLPGAGPSPTPSPTGQPPECQTDPGAICGSSGNDNLQGTPNDDVFYAGSGDDVIDGGGGNDKIFGGDGNDTLNGHEGKDEINGGNGNDLIVGGPDKDSLVGGQGNDRIFGDDRPAAQSASRREVRAAQAGAAPDVINGGGGNDSILGGGGGDKVEGGSGADAVAGQAGADKVHAGGAKDSVVGGGGKDSMWGDKGNDKLKGEAGNDTLYGGEGVNDFNGGAGKDHCILETKKDKKNLKSCEKKAFNFAFNFWPAKQPF